MHVIYITHMTRCYIRTNSVKIMGKPAWFFHISYIHEYQLYFSRKKIDSMHRLKYFPRVPSANRLEKRLGRIKTVYRNIILFELFFLVGR